MLFLVTGILGVAAAIWLLYEDSRSGDLLQIPKTGKSFKEEWEEKQAMEQLNKLQRGARDSLVLYHGGPSGSSINDTE